MAERVWTVRDALDWTVEFLAQKGTEQPRLSAEWLLSAATGLSRVELYTQFARPLSPHERALLRESVKRRATGEPLQYVTGEMPFRHIVVQVRPGVFIPRPETEVLVDVVLEHLRGRGIEQPAVADLCTGSGAVALSLASEHPGARVYATDLSPDAVEVATGNAARLGVGERVSVTCGDLLGPLDRALKGELSAVVANPPYIPSADVDGLAEEILGFEPHLALDGGPDGLETARRIMRDALEWLEPGGLLAMELDERRVKDAVNEMREWYEDVRTVSDLTGRDRIATGVRSQERTV